jgi:hypothetical protein
MPPLPVLRLFSYIVAGLVLMLAGCRTTAIAPRFAAATEPRTPRPVPRLDTATATTAPKFPAAPPRRVKATVQSQAADTLSHIPLGKKKQAKQSDNSYPKAAATDTVTSPAQRMIPRELRKPSSPKLFTAQRVVHYSLHFLFPAVLALVFFPMMWQTAYLIMLATMLMDLDHLLATPIFDPTRCSIGHHPLHSFYAIPVYVLMLLLPATQIVAVGMLFHLFTDTVDCVWSFRYCQECYANSRIRGLVDWMRKLLGRKSVE